MNSNSACLIFIVFMEQKIIKQQTTDLLNCTSLRTSFHNRDEAKHVLQITNHSPIAAAYISDACIYALM